MIHYKPSGRIAAYCDASLTAKGSRSTTDVARVTCSACKVEIRHAVG